MADRNVIVRLKAEIADFKRGMQEAAKATEQVGSKGQESGWKASTALGEVVQSATKHREAWSTAGTALLGYGAAVTGITAAVLKTGISYNTLQQTARAALSTLLGGAEAANAQMDKLDDFARNSPFAKQVFIEAQRQLIGFGMEADKVLPTLDAIQNAVAATGGSNQDIAELASIIAKIGASAKISAVDLDMFANRGVDAATLIGSQMGKTGAQIREEITAGTLDAGEAIDALTAGMQERFGGAAASVKNTVTGAFDRVKAALRDVSSEWTAWLVNPEAAEGGALAAGLNKIADILQGFRSMPDPFKNVLGGLFAVSGIAATAAGSFLLLMPRIVETKAAFATLAATMPRATAALTAAKNTLMGPWGAAIAAATIGLGVWAAKQGESRARVEELTASLDAQTGAVTANTREIIAKKLQDEGLLEDAQRLGIAHGVLTDAILGDTAARQTLNTVIEEAIRLGNEHSSAMADSGGVYASNKKSAEDLQSALSGLGGEVQQATADHQQLSSEVEGSAAAQDQAAEATAGLAAEQARLAEQAQIAADANLELANAVLEAANAALAASNSAIGYENALAKATEAVKENGRNLDITTEKGRENQSALNNVAAAALKLAEDNLKAGQSTDQVGRSMQAAREDFIATAMAMGANRAEAVRMADQYGLNKRTVDALSQSLDSVPSETVANITTNADIAIAKIAAVRAAIERVSGKHITFTTSVSGPGATMVQRGQIAAFNSGGLLDKTRLGMVKQYASGGFFDGAIGAQQPQVRPYSGPRGLLWSEEGSGPWEAFISGHPAKRDRSLRIWLDVGRRLGAIAAHAEGGLQERAARYAGPVARPVGATGGGTMRIEGVLDTPFGPSAVRGVVRSELDKVGRTLGGY